MILTPKLPSNELDLLYKDEGKCGVYLCSAKISILRVHFFLYPINVNMKNFIAVSAKNILGSAMIGP